MDWITLLPYDLVSLIFSHLEFKERVICTEVSKTWRDFLLKWAGMWTEVVLRLPADKHAAMSCLGWLERIDGNHIRQFSCIPSTPFLCSAALHLISTARWCRLEKIELSTNYHERVDHAKHIAICSSPWMTIIQNCAQNLRQITLCTSEICMNQYDFYSILSSCPGLTRFSYWYGEQQISHSLGVSRTPTQIRNDLSDVRHLALTHLDWFTECDLPHHKLFSLCPNLQELAIFGRNNNQASIQALITEVVQKTNPSLQVFRLGVISPETSPKQASRAGTYPGLRHLEISFMPTTRPSYPHLSIRSIPRRSSGTAF
ncbi:hypothetical protein BCR43DRAFT_339186 [Syncephalastrum racemosum]|uniref:F-box domain-containing protein n=1 Tax=Syncephalastrum racemosum TaxID=13706 RepID=A0A1X2H8V3_SYNRA|nr:hypothetical protein BCR43DRAFT_339186 [Syncephalastrum racemosum]